MVIYWPLVTFVGLSCDDLAFMCGTLVFWLAFRVMIWPLCVALRSYVVAFWGFDVALRANVVAFRGLCLAFRSNRWR